MVVRGIRGVIGTAVPEAAVDEDGDAFSQEDNISSSARDRQGMVHAIAQAQAMQLPTNENLGFRVASSLLDEAPTVLVRWR